MPFYTHDHDDEFERRLAARERGLSDMLRAHDALGAGDGSHDVTDFKDLAADASLHALETVQLEHAAHELEQVIAARHRIKEGSFGDCAQCGEPISLARLAALPASPLCASCQAAHEHALTHARRMP